MERERDDLRFLDCDRENGAGIGLDEAASFFSLSRGTVPTAPSGRVSRCSGRPRPKRGGVRRPTKGGRDVTGKTMGNETISRACPSAPAFSAAARPRRALRNNEAPLRTVTQYRRRPRFDNSFPFTPFFGRAELALLLEGPGLAIGYVNASKAADVRVSIYSFQVLLA